MSGAGGGSRADRARGGRDTRRQPSAPSIGGAVLRLAGVLGTAYLVLALALSYWQVVDANSLSNAPGNPLTQAALLHTKPGTIFDARGTRLAWSVPLAGGTWERRYSDPSLSPVIGYRSQVYGAAGLERSENAVLLGLGTSPVDQMLRKLRPTATSAEDIVLSIDDRLQKDAAALLGDRTGAVVALDPATGRVLAMVSTPSFDANKIADPATAAAYFPQLLADPHAPLLDRATQGLFVPGSAFKIVTSIAALGSGTITPQTGFPDQPAEEHTGFLVDGYRVTDGHHLFTGNTVLDFEQAIEVSCNIYFAHVGLLLGGPTLLSWAAKLGFGAPLPFVLPTAASQVTAPHGPDPELTNPVDLANAAYGQAEVLATPLQMALVASTVANDGVLMRPQLVTATRGTDGVTHPQPPQEWRRVVSPSVAQEIKQAMQAAVESAWGKPFSGLAAVPGVPTAGKTGTAQLGGTGQPDSWFIGFAPVSQPRIAVAVVIEHGGSGATAAAPLAGKLMADALGLGR